jgi:hypothetical protein
MSFYMATAGIRCGPNVIRIISLNSDWVHIIAKCVNNMLILPYPCIGRYQSYHLPQTELWTVLSPWCSPWCSAPSIFDFVISVSLSCQPLHFCRLHRPCHNFYLIVSSSDSKFLSQATYIVSFCQLFWLSLFLSSWSILIKVSGNHKIKI